MLFQAMAQPLKSGKCQRDGWEQFREVRVSVLQWASSLLRLEKQRVTDSDEIGEKVPTD